MILTVTPNPALDRILVIDEIRPGETMRTDQVSHSVGGKGFVASVVLRAFGVDTLALGILAGATGRQLADLLDSYGVRLDLIWVAGETRLAHVIVEQRHHRHSHLIAGSLPTTAEALADLLQRYQAHLPQAAWVIGAGTLAPGAPVDLYRRLTELASKAGIPILLDILGPPFLAALPARPTVLKMNRAEFAETFYIPINSLADLQAQAQAVRQRENIPALVITCGEDGLLALTPEGGYWAVSPPQTVISAAGAGDTVSAVLAWRFSQGDGWLEALRWAAAASAASVLTEGTAEVSQTEVERILPQVRVEAL
jgi:1-phosphofructokinase family hexose kinase